MERFIHSKKFFYLAWLGRFFLFIVLFYSIAIGSVETPIIASFILLSFCSLFLKNKLSYFYDFLYMVVIVFNTSSFIWDAYGMVDYYDGIVHFVTPFLLVVLAGHLTASYFKKPADNKFVIIVFLTGFGVLLGCFWEIVEWISENTFLPYSVMFGLEDTMSDLMLDFVGSMVGATIYTYVLAGIKSASQIEPNKLHYRKAFLSSLLASAALLLFIGV